MCILISSKGQVSMGGLGIMDREFGGGESIRGRKL